MFARLTGTLRAAPTTVPALAALALFVVWSADQAGYPLTHWAPGALIVLVLLGIAAGVVPLRLSGMPPAVRVALGCMALYTVLGFLSILWAGSPGDAWEGADRTLLYLLVFALFACWRQQGASAAVLLSAWTLALIGLAVFVVLHLRGGDLQRLIPGGRLVYPSGYVNANAAQWLMAFWPALLLARSDRLPWALRGLLAGGAVLLAELALLSQSRGSLYAMAVVLVLVLVLIPERLRSFALLVPVAGGIAAATPALLRVGSRLSSGNYSRGALDRASLAMLASALGVALVVALAAAIEGRVSSGGSTATNLRRGVGAVALLTLVAILVGGWAAAGNPLARVEHGWQTFKGGYTAGNYTGTRLVSGLGSNRYDFYRVALDEFAAHPLAGIGAENFSQQYLRHGRSEETPRYPHSLELRTLSQTGLLGALLAVLGLGAALLGAARALRRSDPLARSVAAAALAGFGYWFLHGSVDWFWEFAGLGAPAFALLGLACSLAPSARPAGAVAEASRAERAPRSRGRRGLMAALAALLAGTTVVSLAAPWLSQLQVQRAARVWVRSPAQAYAQLGDAARLNPLSDEPYLVAGSIAVRFGDLPRADRDFELALRRVPADAYAVLERGAIASTRGDRRDARRLLERAAYLNPRDPLTREALELVRRGGRVAVGGLNDAILSKAQQLS